MRLAEWQLNDVRDALERYRQVCEAQIEDDYEWDEKEEKEYVVKKKNMYHYPHERQAMIDLIESVVEIANRASSVE